MLPGVVFHRRVHINEKRTLRGGLGRRARGQEIAQGVAKGKWFAELHRSRPSIFYLRASGTTRASRWRCRLARHARA
jgi:hypothetical protein